MSPYVSEAQRKKFHSLLEQGKIDKKTVDEYDAASKGLKLPDRVKPKVVIKPPLKKVKGL
jgi:hypothetical protein